MEFPELDAYVPVTVTLDFEGRWKLCREWPQILFVSKQKGVAKPAEWEKLNLRRGYKDLFWKKSESQRVL